mmetsp:Transcript_47798/g.94631  ORF Transcript_47798/g.94631 Transcript_47798/m.94631 type:complete len:277 (+) Transcript_47798:311-1141(+)
MQRLPRRPNAVQLLPEARAFALDHGALLARLLQLCHGGLPDLSRGRMLVLKAVQRFAERVPLAAQLFDGLLRVTRLLFERRGVNGHAGLLSLELGVPSLELGDLFLYSSNLFGGRLGIERSASPIDWLVVLDLQGSFTEFALLDLDCVHLGHQLAFQGGNIRRRERALALHFALLGADPRLQLGDLAPCVLHNLVGAFHGGVRLLRELVLQSLIFFADGQLLLPRQIRRFHLAHAVKLDSKIPLVGVAVRAELELQDVAHSGHRAFAAGLGCEEGA